MFRTALFFGLLLLIVLAGRQGAETIVDNRPPPRYRVTFIEPLETGEAKELLRKYDVSLLHITYVAPGFSGNGLVTNIERIEDVAENIIRAWDRDASDRSITKKERESAGRLLSWSRNNRLQVGGFVGIGAPAEGLKSDTLIKRVEEF